MHPDGGGLYLQIGGVGTKSWIYRYSLHGKTREMGLGSLLAVGLSDAREKAADCRKIRDNGISAGATQVVGAEARADTRLSAVSLPLET